MDNEAEQLMSSENSSDTSTTTAAEIGSGSGNDAQMLNPDVLISLTAPKRCSRGFHGRSHYVVQRFVPPELLRKYKLGTVHVDAAVDLFVQLSLVELDTGAGNADTAENCQRSDN